jgi:hypothetical protein
MLLLDLSSNGASEICLARRPKSGHDWISGLRLQPTQSLDELPAFLAGLGIDCKKLIHLRHDPNRGLIFGIEFYCIEELSPRMCPACPVHDFGSTNMIVSAVAVALEQTLEVTQEPFGTFSFPAHPKIEHNCGTQPTVLHAKVDSLFLAGAAVRGSFQIASLKHSL